MLETLLQQKSVTTAERGAVPKHVQDYCGSLRHIDQSKMKVRIAVSENVRPVMSILENRSLHGQAPKGGLGCRRISSNSMTCLSDDCIVA